MEIIDLVKAALEAAKVAEKAGAAADKAVATAAVTKAAAGVARAEASMEDACGRFARASARAEGERRRARESHSRALKCWVWGVVGLEHHLTAPEWAEARRLAREAAERLDLAERLERVALHALAGRPDAREVIERALRRRPRGESPLRDKLGATAGAALTRACREETAHAARRQAGESGREAGWAGGSRRPTIITRL